MEHEEVQRRAAEKLAELNAAQAALAQATSDAANQDYKAAQSAIMTIAQLTPEIVQNTNKLCEYENEEQRQVMLDNVRDICKANKLVCESLEHANIKELNLAAIKFAKSSAKLYYIFDQTATPMRHNQILDLTKASCEKSSAMMSNVYELAETAGGREGSIIEESTVKVVDGAQALLIVAQLTAPSIDDGKCKTALITSANNLSSLTEDLSAKLAPIVQDPKHSSFGEKLVKDGKEFDENLEKLIAACNTKPAVRPKKPAPPTRHQSLSGDDKLKATKNIHFCKSVDVVQDNITRAEEQVKKAYNQKSLPPTIVGEQEKLQDLMEKNLALAGVTVAQLISDMSPHHVNYDNAIKCTKVLAEIFPEIVKAGTELGNAKEDIDKKEFLGDLLSLCEASTKLCNTAKNDTQNLNTVAIDFGDKAAKLLYKVSAEIDPTQEKEVIHRAKEIGDSASRLAVRGAEGADAADARAHALCAAGARCADAASELMYTAKLVAPSIHDPESQKALLDVSNQLSSKSNEFMLTWQPFSSNPEHMTFVMELDAEAKQLKSLLANFKQDLKDNKMVRRRILEDETVQDTPLRQLASNILETAKRKAETSSCPEERRNHNNYSSKLAAAIKDLDLANARCRNSPRDIQRREELEEAVQHLQQICLESRIQSASGDQNRFVDLMDLINDVSSDAKQLSDETSNVKAVHNKDAIIIIKDEADDIIKEAKEATKPNVSDDGGAMDDIMIIKQFAEKCDDRVNALLKVIEEIHEEPYKTALRDKLIHLKGSSDMLRFAVNSHIAAASSAALDMNMVDFDELEKNIDNILQSTRKTKNIDNEKESAAAAMATATTLCSAVAYRNAAEKIPPALAAYLLETRSKTDLSDPKQKYKLEEHLKKLIHLLQTQALASSRRIATWQEADDGEIAEITHQIIQEIESFNKDDNDEVQKSTDIDVVTESDLKKLLLPSKGAVVRGNQKELSHQLSQHMQKLGSMASMVQLGVGRRESLARTLHALADVAMQLALIARSVPTHDPITKMRIEDATQTMCSTTYNLLKTAEVASQDPQHPDTHRRLHEACRLLNESITKLSRVTLPEDRMQRDCGEIARNLQLQLGLLQTDYPTCSMTYAACLKPLENQNNLQSLQSEEPMSREECSAHLQYLSSMVCHSAEYAAQCGYLLSLPEEHQYIAKEGFLNVPRIRNITGEIRLACLKIIRSKFVEDANYSQSDINKYIIELQEVTQEAAAKMRDPHVRKEVSDSLQEMECASKDLREALTRGPGEMNTITPLASRLLDATEDFSSVTTHLAVPSGIKPSAEKKARSEEVINYAKTLIIKTQALVKQVGSSDHEVLTWKMFAIGKQGVTTAYEDFVCSIIENGRRAGFTEVAEKKEEAPKKTFIEIQLDLANKWLTKPASKPEVKTAGIEGVRNIIELAEKVSEDMKGEEKVDMQGMVDESKELLEQCVVKYNSEKASLLMERLKELHKMLTWRVVTRVVEDFLEDEPLEDLDIIADSETDEKKRKYILDKKIAELLAQLGRVKKTARFVADAGSKVPSEDLIQTKDQVELLAPALVKAAQKRIETPNNMEAVNNYKKLLAEYNQSMARIREICDRSVDPVDFAQAAGDTIQRMREESTAKNDPQTCTTTSRTITRLGLRVIEAGLCSQEAKNDPELKQALSEARSRLTATTTLRSSRVPDWRDITAEILRTTGEVESFLGGENIFQKQPEPNQPIYAAALDLHATVREWSARDNEIVAVAKRMAVQMARLSEHMNSDRKSELLATSKKIVAGSHQVAALARKLALECTDMRIRTNLLQVCDRIPTISGQLKMLITVKGSSLGQQGSEEDKEAMNTLIGNAQNLMSSIQEVVKAAIGASVKIMSQRGPRMKWVRRNYYQY
ncbi:uncharacterized protein [Epargyreus clarus]|uniref:uncharacterized protein n=1 Tax=Epargyreus clarus TaxID=520877 RepID=UPI003C2C9A5C